MTLLEWARGFPDSFFELPNFYIMTDPRDDTVRIHLRDKGVWEPKVTATILQEFQGGTFVDAGAHWGYYSLLLARKATNIHAFEIHPVTFRYLQLNILINGFGNVRAWPLGLWSSTTWVNSKDLGSNTGGNRIDISSDGKGTVQTARLDDLFEPQSVDFIKVDCEGSDTEILKGAYRILESGHPKLIIEGAPKEFLEKLGYTMTLDCGSDFGPMSLWVKK